MSWRVYYFLVHIWFCVRFHFSVQNKPVIKPRRDPIFNSPHSRTQDLCMCINVKNNNDEGGVFLFVFNGHCCGWRFEIDIIKSQCIKMPSVNDWGWKKIQMNHSDDTCDLENHKPHDTLQHMTKPKRKWEIWALQKCNKKKKKSSFETYNYHHTHFLLLMKSLQ